MGAGLLAIRVERGHCQSPQVPAVNACPVGCSSGGSALCECTYDRVGADAGAKYECSHNGGGSGGGCSSSGVCWGVQCMAGKTTESQVPADSPYGGVHSGSFPGSSAPVLPASLKLSLRASTPTNGEQNPTLSCDSHGAKRNPCPTSSSGSVHHNTKHTPSKRRIASTL